MTTSYQKGLYAEFMVAAYLRLKLYRILDMRLKTYLGEIDIVAQKGRTVVFIEVKMRKGFDAGADAIHVKNQQRVRNAAALYLQKHPEYNDHDTRFDAVILSSPNIFAGWPRHIVNAF